MLGMSASRCWFSAVFRRILLFAATLAILVTALIQLWNHRFEPVPGAPVWRLADLRPGAPAVSGVEWLGPAEKPALRLWVDPEQHPRVALRLAIPGAFAMDALHLRYRQHARGLRAGSEKWQTGRIMIEWHPTDAAGGPEIDPVGGAVDDKQSGPMAMVVVPACGPALPALRLEQLGRAGEFTFEDLEIIAVRERGFWKTTRWLLVAGFFVWLYLLARAGSRVQRWRSLVAAMVWLVMGIHFVIPGPWKIQRPLLGDFQLSMAGAGVSSRQAPPPVTPPAAPAVRSGEVTASGEILPQGGLALRVKHVISAARPLLHILLLLAPTLASAWLIGRRTTLLLAILCACAIELAQLALGYGFDWIDVSDLLTDAMGIVLGLWLARRFDLLWLRVWLRRRVPGDDRS